MTVNNFLKNKDNISLSQARDIVVKEALARNTKDSIHNFEQNYEKVIKDYYSNPALAMSSISFELEKLESFSSWLEELKKDDNMHKYMIFIVSKMLDGDPLSHSIFTAIYKDLGKELLLLSRKSFNSYPELKEGVANSDAGANSRAIINAEHWINSSDGKDILCVGVVYKSDIENLIGEDCG